jgi:hypothetical protein
MHQYTTHNSIHLIERIGRGIDVQSIYWWKTSSGSYNNTPYRELEGVNNFTAIKEKIDAASMLFKKSKE